eukprot:COSAG03_NODE_307_length_9149_cov_3.027293_5_plen_76_part_00
MRCLKHSNSCLAQMKTGVFDRRETSRSGCATSWPGPGRGFGCSAREYLGQADVLTCPPVVQTVLQQRRGRQHQQS